MKNMLLGLELTLLGMGVVFAALIALTMVMKLLRHFSGEKRPGGSLSKAFEPAATSSMARRTSGPTPEVVAAVTAAIAAYLNQPAGSFAVCAVRPVSETGSAWASSGRIQQMLAKDALFRRGTQR